LCKRQPTVLTLFIRRFIPKKMQFLFKKRLDWYEMRDISYNQIMEVPIISGCFMLFNRKYLDEIGYFDKNMFMYFEDYDLTLRMSKKYKTILYPHVNIYHHWARGAHNSTKLAIVFAQSAVYFFNKHGWKFY
ncbi:MAG: glycosyltransferase family 2 protein, partial [Microcystis sp.]